MVTKNNAFDWQLTPAPESMGHVRIVAQDEFDPKQCRERR
jgi:hypothetical protein